ncbi:MAG: hypothetical protein Q4F57_01945 [Weeksellaceae bacterium]|nr:hypothetical protein [Weeksellaceae bacterium]
MKKFLLIALLSIGFFGQAQEVVTASNDLQADYRNEISLGLLDFVAFKSVQVQYERFLPNNKSLAIRAGLFDTFNLIEMENNEWESKAFSLMTSLRFHMGRYDHRGFYFFPYTKFIVGQYEFERYNWVNNQSSTERIEQDATNISVGFGFGYKWKFIERYTVTLENYIGRSLYRAQAADDNIVNFELEYRPYVGFGYQF